MAAAAAAAAAAADAVRGAVEAAEQEGFKLKAQKLKVSSGTIYLSSRIVFVAIYVLGSTVLSCSSSGVAFVFVSVVGFIRW